MNKKLRRLIVLVSFVVALVLLVSCSKLSSVTRQEHVHHMSHSVMPFDMSKTVHIFKMTETGGVQKVITKDQGATDQITLIQQHLQHEAERFQQGDYSDPAKLHGADMPGLMGLQTGADRIKVSYADLSFGGKITFETRDIHLLTSVHRWFGAQLSEHGADAKSE